MTDIIQIGGQPVTLPEIIVFGQIERMWPAVQALNGATDTIERVSHSVDIIAALLYRSNPILTPSEIRERLRAEEMPALVSAIPGIFIRAGFVAKGEVEPAALNSMATSAE